MRKRREFVASSNDIVLGCNGVFSRFSPGEWLYDFYSNRYPVHVAEFDKEPNIDAIENEIAVRNIYFRKVKEYYVSNNKVPPSKKKMLKRYHRRMEMFRALLNNKPQQVARA